MIKKILQIIFIFLLGQIFVQSMAQLCFALESCTDKKRECDTTERCEYLAQIQMKEQIQQLFKNKNLKQQAIAQAKRDMPGASPKDVSHHAGDLMYQSVMQRAMDGRTITLPTCNASLQPPPGWETNNACRSYPLRKDGGELLSGDLDGKNTCREFVDASREHEKFHAARCHAAQKNSQIDREDINQFINEEVNAYQKEINYLKKMKFWKKAKCTPKETTVQDSAAKAAKGAKALKAGGRI